MSPHNQPRSRFAAPIGLLLLILPALLANLAEAAIIGPFKIQATSPRTRINNQFVQAIVTEATFFGWSLRSTGSDFYLDSSTNLLYSNVDDRFLDKNVKVYAHGRFDAPRYYGEARLQTKARLGSNFDTQAWKCAVEGTQLKCSGPYGSKFFVCSEYDWTFLKSSDPGLGCQSIRFDVV